MSQDTSQHSVSVAACLVDAEGRVLVVQRRDSGRWEPPGGILELAESIPDGLRREVNEETGLNVEIEALTGVYKNLPRGIVALVFRCHAVGGVLTLNDEVTAFHWLTRSELAGAVAEAFAVRLTDGLDYAGVPAIRSHDGEHVLT